MSKKSGGQKQTVVPNVVNPPTEVSCGICRSPDNSRMVACDECGQWCHYKCVGVDEGIAEQDWSCNKCVAGTTQIPPGFSTPVAGGNTVHSQQTNQPVINQELVEQFQDMFFNPNAGPDNVQEQRTSQYVRDNEFLREELQKMQKQVDYQQKIFDQLLREKDVERQNALKRQRDCFEDVLKQRFQQQQPGDRVTGGAVPKASSTVINTAGAGKSQEMNLLEERQALEKRHLEERLALLQRSEVRGSVPAATFDGAARTNNPGAGSRSMNDWSEADYVNFFSTSSSLELSRSQLAARQAVARDLPIFSGNPEEWPLFISSFESTTRMCGYSDEENLLRLQRSLKGKALEVVRSRLLHPSCLAGVIVTLRTMFGRPEVIVHSLVSRIREMPSPKAEKLNTLIDFGVAVQNVCATIKACGLDEYLCNVALLQELVERLPPSIKLNWAMHRQTLARLTLSDFGNWLGKMVEAACIVTIPTVNYTTLDRRGRKNDNFINVHSEVEANGYDIPSKAAPWHPKEDCLVCKGGCSSVDICKRFIAMDIGSRWSALKEHKLCRKCLRKHFGACQIKSPCGKNDCTFMHNPLLHDDSRYKQPAPSKPATVVKQAVVAKEVTANKQAASFQQATTSRHGAASKQESQQSCNTHMDSTGKVLFRYVPVVIHGRDKSVKTYAFLDDGSSATLVEHSLLEELQLEGTPHPLCLNWTGGQQRDEKESVRVSLKISGTHNQNKTFVLPKVHSVRDLSLPPQSVSMAALSARYKHLGGLPIGSYNSVCPRILIGIDNCRLGHPLNSSEGYEDQPVAAKTRLGWLVYGPCTVASGSANSNYTACHSFHICACSREADTILDASLKEYFSMENLGISMTKPRLSREDERSQQLLSSLTHFNGDRYETGLLWRYDDARLPDNRTMALKRLLCLEKRMGKDAELAETLRAKMIEYEEKGYIRKLTPAEVAVRSARTWYLPIFPVVNPNKPGKVRIVWDAAATVGGVSLNSLLLTGPDQLTSLPTVLHGFREFRFAITGDIREMFHQVLVREEDQQSQRILWRGGNPERDPEVFVMKVMTFGATCSPSCAQYVKNQNADRFQTQFPRAVDCIKKEHYVDDMLTSIESEEEAVKLANDVRFVHSQGGFEIRNWLSNSAKVIKSLDVNSSTEKNLNISSEMATEKVLGMWWCTATDTFTFKLSPRHDKKLLSGRKIPTKREVLRTLMTVYDPLGLIANFLMYLKVLLQEIWRAGTGWDEEIPSELAERWMLWLRVLPRVEDIQIPRCYRVFTTAEKDNLIQLHVFVDASEKGFAAVAYLRFEQHGKVECALVGAKTRVAPLKYLSIPRLELEAAVVGARLSKNIVESHRLDISERFFYTDSRNVACWLRADHRQYSKYVAHRREEILETTELREWHWISTKLNVADEGTKWQKIPDLTSSSRWFRGPDFLWQPRSEWPLEEKDPGTTIEEIRPSVLHHVVCEPLVRVENFSRWKRLMRTVAFVMRFPMNIRSKLAGKPITTEPLGQEELLRAEYFIYKQVQHQTYPEEVRLLMSDDLGSRKRIIPKKSPLYQLSPVIDEYGVLRMRGRIGACKYVDEATKQPILLPKRNHVTDLVVADYHRKCRHLNHATARNEIRQKYHIPELHAALDRARRDCQLCKIRRANPQPPLMAELPEARLAAFHRPFSYTGIDYFGPMQVVVGRRVEKRWGVLLTCLTVRAIHIEIAHSINTDSCILALRNFIARRGAPIEFFSDRGTNFIGASRELREALQQVNQDKIMEHFVSPDTKWTFNPPAAPHFGGCWERLIQSVKRVLDQVKPKRLPTDEILRNMLLEIEMIINCRPLTHIPLDDETSSCLTPNHFLLGSSNGSKPPIAFDDRAVALRHSWKMSQVFANEFWRRWIIEYLPTITRRTKWFEPAKPIEVGDIVLIVDNNLPRNCWLKGRVVAVVRSKDGQVRQAAVQTTKGLVLERPAVKIAVLDVGSKVSKSGQ